MSESWRNKCLELVRKTILAKEDASKFFPDTMTRVSDLVGYTTKVVSALEQFQECVRYLNTRRSRGSIITDISGEDDLQDVIFLMLRPWISDLTPENPTDRVAARYVITDFLSKELNTVIEAKFVRDKRHGREISKELNDDIEMYKNHPNCLQLVFFVYDPDALIPDVSSLRGQISGIRRYNGKTLNVYCIVKP